MLFKLYVGSNNTTKVLEKNKAIRITSKHFNGFTAYDGLGYWQGKPEASLIIEIETNKKDGIKKLAQNLAKELKQQVIGVAEIGTLHFIGAKI